MRVSLGCTCLLPLLLAAPLAGQTPAALNLMPRAADSVGAAGPLDPPPLPPTQGRAADVEAYPWPPPVEDRVLAGLIEEALAQNPGLAVARDAAEAAANRPAQAGSLPDPMVFAGYTNDGFSPSLGTQEMTTLGVAASQELFYPGKRALRAGLAAREAEQIGQRAERARRGVEAAVKRAYYGLLLSRELLEVVADQEEIWTQLEAVARARYAVGQGAQQDVLRAQVEVTRIGQLRLEQEAEAAIRLADLNRLLDRAPTAPLESPARLALRAIDGGHEPLVAWAAGVSPELRGSRLGVEQAALAVELAKRQFRPDFSVQAGYMHRGSLDPMWQAGFGVSVPLYRRRLHAGLAEAEAALRSSQRGAESVGLQLRFRTQERLAQLAAAERIAILYGQGIVPQDRMSVEAAIANYQTGQVPFIAVLEALTTLYNDRSTYLRLLAGHEQILAGLEEASLEATSSGVWAGAGAMAAAGGSGASMAGSSGTGSSMGGAAGMGNP